MQRRRYVRLAALAVAAFARLVDADPEADADREFRQAAQLAAAGSARAIEAYEALGAARPVTRWTDDAWLEAARVAERTGDYARAHRDLAQALAITTDDQLARRARAELDRLSRFIGDRGEWSRVAAEHERLANQVLGKGDPKPTLRELELLVEGNALYPRAADVMIVIAKGWERDGAGDRALEWLARAKLAAVDPTVRQRASAELVRALIRHGSLEAARAEIDGVGDSGLRRELAAQLASAEWKQTVRWILWGLVAVIAGLAIFVLWRGSKSWREMARRLVHPPIEVLFFVPIAAVIGLVAQTGNPLAARAVRWIAISGALIAWLSGVILDEVRARRGSIGFLRAATHAALAAIAVGCCVYLAIDRDRMIDLVIETWRAGPSAR